MWVIIIVIAFVIYILFKFNTDRNDQSSQILEQGGMRNKYSILVQCLCADRGQVVSERASSLTLGASSYGGSVYFVLTQTFGNLTIVWKTQSPLAGFHTLEWEFSESMDQMKMYERINTDIKDYTLKMN